MSGFQSLGIDRKLKKTFTPFAPSKKTGEPSVFSFKKGKDGDGYIKVCPDWFYSSADVFKADISTKLLYGMAEDGTRTKQILRSTFFDHIPTIQIREYQQDSRLNQVFSLLGSLASGFNDGKSDDKGGMTIGDGAFQISGIQLAWKIFQKVISDPGKLIDKLKESLKPTWTFSINKGKMNESQFISVVNFPHVFYYQLLAITTLNYYTLPHSGTKIREANGETGWNSGHRGGIQGGDGMLGGLANFIGVKQLNVTTTPTWDGVDNAESTTIECTIDLFNDSVEAACQNFIFVNTILPAAMYTQYHIFQQSPSLFDVKVDGLGRFFMCTGDFKVEFKGVLRTPSQEVLKTLVTKYLKPEYSIDESTLRKTGIAKIPDVYHVSLTFKSLLPNNFNNFIYSVSCGESIENIKDSDSLWGGIGKNLQQAFSDIKNDIKSDEEEKIQKAVLESGLGGSVSEVEANGGRVERDGDGYKVIRD